jgi:hypothetical protein
MTTKGSLIAATLLAVGALAVSSPGAQARIVCNEEGECWHVHGHAYGLWGLPIPPDWRWREGEYRGWRERGWREHEGRGHWHGDQWEQD